MANNMDNAKLSKALEEYAKEAYKRIEPYYVFYTKTIYIVWVVCFAVIFSSLFLLPFLAALILAAPIIVANFLLFFAWYERDIQGKRDEHRGEHGIFTNLAKYDYIHDASLALEGVVLSVQRIEDKVFIEAYLTPRGLSFFYKKKMPHTQQASEEDAMVEYCRGLVARMLQKNQGDVWIFFYANPMAPEDSDTFMDNLDAIVGDTIHQNNNLLPEDIREKGLQMSEVYAYLYCVENTLRLFIDRFFRARHGDNYESSITVNNKTKKKIDERKNNEAKNDWMSVRGDNFLYYLDFKELGDIILNNQELLACFPDEIWVKSKIQDLGNIRNLVAHNSFVSSHEKEVIRTTYNSIVRQVANKV